MTSILSRLGITGPKNAIRAYWWAGEDNRNFGDIVTPYLIEKMTGQSPILCNRFCLKEYYIMTGSVIEHANKNAIVWGTGMMYRDQKIKRPKEIHAVRGPITRKRMQELGVDCPEVYGDPALLLPKFYSPSVEKKYDIGIIPHYIDLERVNKKVVSDKTLVIDLFNPVEKVVDMILQCRATISSSLHGIIVSQTYKIPSIWVEFSDMVGGDGTKFKDYLLSVNMDPYAPVNMTMDKLTDRELDKCVQKASSNIDIDLKKLLQVCPIYRGDI